MPRRIKIAHKTTMSAYGLTVALTHGDDSVALNYGQGAYTLTVYREGRVWRGQSNRLGHFAASTLQEVVSQFAMVILEQRAS